MLNPMCKICGNRHRLSDPHIWNDEKRVEVVQELKKAVDTIVDRPKLVDKPKRLGKYLDADKRREYQREWVRKKRAERGES